MWIESVLELVNPMQCKVLLLGCLSAAMLGSCGSSPTRQPIDASVPTGDAPADASDVPLAVQDIPLTVNRDLDVLFLVDDSTSMTDKQTNVAAAIPAFLEVLAAGPDGLPNLHVAVVTSDMGTQGAEDAAPGPAIRGGCRDRGKGGVMQIRGTSNIAGLFLSDVAQPDGSRARNYTGDLATAVAGMLKVGALGCGFEQSLEAVKQALLPTNAPNTGFLRPAANLAIVIVSDEDDCSLAHSTLLTPDETTFGALQSFRCTQYGITCEQGGGTAEAMAALGRKTRCRPVEDTTYLTRVSDYAAFFKGLKADPSQVFVAAAVGALEPFTTELRAPDGEMLRIPALAHSCTYTSATNTTETADPPVRIQALLDLFPERSAAMRICQQDLTTDLRALATRMQTAGGGRCIADLLLDLDANAPGVQFDCGVSAVRGATEKVLPRCTPEDNTASNAPCWHLVEDAASCPAAQHLRVAVEGADALERDAHLIVHCRI